MQHVIKTIILAAEQADTEFACFVVLKTFNYVGITLGLHHEREIPKDDEYFISIEYGKGRASAQDWY